jgi:hypothetical protein
MFQLWITRMKWEVRDHMFANYMERTDAVKKLLTLALVACFACTLSIGCAAKSTSKPVDPPKPASGAPASSTPAPK